MTSASATDFDEDSDRTLLATTPPRRREVRRDEDGAVAPTLLGVRAREETHNSTTSYTGSHCNTQHGRRRRFS